MSRHFRLLFGSMPYLLRSSVPATGAPQQQLAPGKQVDRQPPDLGASAAAGVDETTAIVFAGAIGFEIICYRGMSNFELI